MLKTTIIFFLLLIFAPIVKAQRPFTITGVLPAMYNGADIQLTSFDKAFQPIITTAKNGAFKITGNINEPYEYVYLSAFKDDKKLGGCSFFIKNGQMAINVQSFSTQGLRSTISFINIPFIKELQRYDSLTKPIEENRVEASKILFTIEKGIRKGLNRDSMATIVKTLQTDLLNRKIQFIRELPKSYIALHIYNKEIVSRPIPLPDSLAELFKIFDPSLKATGLGCSINALLQKKKSLLINNVMPAFSFVTDQGQPYELSAFRKQKYVLLCFWASWCGPCVKNIPLLKKIAAQYETKGLQLISASIDDNDTQWRQALKKHELPWLQTCDLPDQIKGERLRSLYDIRYIPQYFLIDRDGKLIYHSGQTHDGNDDKYALLQQTLEKLLQ